MSVAGDDQVVVDVDDGSGHVDIGTRRGRIDIVQIAAEFTQRIDT